MHPTPKTLHPTPYTLHPAPYTPHPTPHTLYPAPYTLYTLHPTHPTPNTPYTLHLTPYTLHPTQVPEENENAPPSLIDVESTEKISTVSDLVKEADDMNLVRLLSLRPSTLSLSVYSPFVFLLFD